MTGRRENVDRLTELFSSGLFVGEDGQPDHRLAVYLLDREGRNMQRYSAAGLDVARLLKDLDRLAGR